MFKKKKKKDKRDDLLLLVPLHVKNVLDVGCGSGILGAKLRKKGIEVVGIEKDEQAYAQARGKINKAILADVEELDLSYPVGYFDCILFADILEHLRDPVSILMKYGKYLNDKGFVIASIPNVRYYKIILRLLFGGTWDYVDKGILDVTHIRFFTLVNMKELFIKAGYSVLCMQRNLVASRGFRLLNFILFNSLKDFLTYQYYFKLRKASDREILVPKRRIHQF